MGGLDFFVWAQHWWAQWGLRDTARWTFVDFWLLLLEPVDLFLLSALVLPDRQDGATVDLGSWFFHNRRWFFSIMFFLPVLSIAEELIRAGHVGSVLNLAFLLAFSIVTIAGVLLTSRKAQEILCGQAACITVLYVALLFLRLA